VWELRAKKVAGKSRKKKKSKFITQERGRRNHLQGMDKKRAPVESKPEDAKSPERTESTPLSRPFNRKKKTLPEPHKRVLKGREKHRGGMC